MLWERVRDCPEHIAIEGLNASQASIEKAKSVYVNMENDLSIYSTKHWPLSVGSGQERFCILFCVAFCVAIGYTIREVEMIKCFLNVTITKKRSISPNMA